MRGAGFLARVAVLAAASLAAAACGTEETAAPYEVPSTDGIAFESISLVVTATSNGEAVLLTVYVMAEDSGRQLAGSDRIVAQAADAQPVQLAELDTLAYVALLPTRETTFELALLRDGKPEARVAIDLPDAFALQVPEEAVRLSDGFEVSWEPTEIATDVQLLNVLGTCVQPLVRRIEQDTGGYAIQAGDLVAVEPAAPCTGEVSLGRSRPKAPLALGPESSLDVAQIRTARLELAP